MRLITTTIALAALLFSSAAGAAGGSEKTPGKGASGPTSGAGDPGGGKGADASDSRDRAQDTTFSNKTWEIGAGFEYHHLVNANGPAGYTGNAGSNNINYYTLGGRWDPTPFDRISIRWGLYQYFLVDNGDSPVRMDDISLGYTRRIPLPGAVTLRVSPSFTIPVSYGAQLAAMYPSPRLSLQADRRFGKYFSLDARLTGALYFFKNAEGGWSYTGGGESGGAVTTGLGSNGGGANPNSRASFSMTLSGELSMPFHEPLSVGLGLYTGYSWYYDVSNGGTCPAGTPSTVCQYGTVMQPTNQPMQQRYGGEIYARYAFPNLGGFRSDLTFAYAPLGDPTLGYTSVLRDGAQHIYGSFLQTSEIYVTLAARY